MCQYILWSIGGTSARAWVIWERERRRGDPHVTDVAIEADFVGAHVGAVEPGDVSAVEGTFEDSGGHEGRESKHDCGGGGKGLHRAGFRRMT